jgi:hypothetical protein
MDPQVRQVLQVAAGAAINVVVWVLWGPEAAVGVGVGGGIGWLINNAWAGAQQAAAESTYRMHDDQADGVTVLSVERVDNGGEPARGSVADDGWSEDGGDVA